MSRKFKIKIFQALRVPPDPACITLWSRKILLFFCITRIVSVKHGIFSNIYIVYGVGSFKSVFYGVRTIFFSKIHQWTNSYDGSTFQQDHRDGEYSKLIQIIINQLEKSKIKKIPTFRKEFVEILNLLNFFLNSPNFYNNL